MFVDSHCHLDFPDFELCQTELVTRAYAAHVTRMLTISTRVSRFPTLTMLTEQFKGVYCTVGTHCLHAHEEPNVTSCDLIQYADHPKCVGIGEAGLDLYYGTENFSLQLQGFRHHISAARKTGLPLVIHARNADNEVAQILEEETKQGIFPYLLHCFSSGNDLAKKGLETGGYISFSGILTFKSSQKLREIAQSIPEDRLLIETDSPYLAPVPFRGKRNEPAYVVHTAEILAQIRGVSLQHIAQITWDNFHRLFRKVKE